LKLDLAFSVVRLTDVYAKILHRNTVTLAFGIQNAFLAAAAAAAIQKYNSEPTLFPLPLGNLPKCYMF